jgi:hypothetical protein
MKRMHDPSPSNKDDNDDDSDGDSDDAKKKSSTKARTKKSTTKGNKESTNSARMRRNCYICGNRTEYYCPGCRRWLCFAEPKYKQKKSLKDPNFLL